MNKTKMNGQLKGLNLEIQHSLYSSYISDTRSLPWFVHLLQPLFFSDKYMFPVFSGLYEIYQQEKTHTEFHLGSLVIGK